MKKPYQRKTEQWAKGLVDILLSNPESPNWARFFIELREDFWRLSHNWTNKTLFVAELARLMKGVRIVK